jgi:hypothetical protein
VTTSDEIPVFATTRPWTKPADAAAARAMTIASPNGTPDSYAAARTQAAKAMTDATDRSISPLMMTNVIATATITFSIDSRNRFTKLSTSR